MCLCEMERKLNWNLIEFNWINNKYLQFYGCVEQDEHSMYDRCIKYTRTHSEINDFVIELIKNEHGPLSQPAIIIFFIVCRFSINKIDQSEWRDRDCRWLSSQQYYLFNLISAIFSRMAQSKFNSDRSIIRILEFHFILLLLGRFCDVFCLASVVNGPILFLALPSINWSENEHMGLIEALIGWMYFSFFSSFLQDIQHESCGQNGSISEYITASPSKYDVKISRPFIPHSKLHRWVIGRLTHDPLFRYLPKIWKIFFFEFLWCFWDFGSLMQTKTSKSFANWWRMWGIYLKMPINQWYRIRTTITMTTMKFVFVCRIWTR